MSFVALGGSAKNGARAVHLTKVVIIVYSAFAFIAGDFLWVRHIWDWQPQARFLILILLCMAWWFEPLWFGHRQKPIEANPRPLFDKQDIPTIIRKDAHAK